MASGPDPDLGQSGAGQPQQEILGPTTLGATEQDRGLLVPYSLIGPLFDNAVGRVRAEMDRELNLKLEEVKTSIKSLEDAVSSQPGWKGVWTQIGAMLVAALTVLGLCFTFIMNSSDRRESGLSVGMEIGQRLEALENADKTATKEIVRPPAGK